MVFSRRAALFYLAGMLDGEGTVAKLPEGKKSSRQVQITNTNYALLLACSACLKVLGISHNILKRSPARIKPGHSPCWDLRIYGRENFEKLTQLPIQSAEKRARLFTLLAGYKN